MKTNLLFETTEIPLNKLHPRICKVYLLTPGWYLHINEQNDYDKTKVLKLLEVCTVAKAKCLLDFAMHDVELQLVVDLTAGVRVWLWTAGMKGKKMLQEWASDQFLSIHPPRVILLSVKICWMTLTVSERLLVLSVVSAFQLGIGFVETARKTKKHVKTKVAVARFPQP